MKTSSIPCFNLLSLTFNREYIQLSLTLAIINGILDKMIYQATKE